MIYISVIGSTKDKFLPFDNIRHPYYVDQSHDGKNIDFLNKFYCELTGLYYLWKNVDAAIKGLEHYRTYFVSDNGLLDETDIYEILNKHDVICGRMHFPSTMGIRNVRHGTQLGPTAPFMTTFCDVINELNPDMGSAFQTYLDGEYFYPTNTLITSNRLFNEYCQALFYVLTRFDKRVPFSSQSLRMDGYMAELFMGFWFTYKRYSMYYAKMIKYHKNLVDIIYSI